MSVLGQKHLKQTHHSFPKALAVFVVLLLAGSAWMHQAMAQQFEVEYGNTTPINIPAFGYAAASTIPVAGVPGTITKVEVSLRDVSHNLPEHIEVILVGPAPANANVVLMAACCDATPASLVDLVFDDTAGSQLPAAGVGPLVSGTFRPSDYGACAPGNPLNPLPNGQNCPYGATLAVFNGTNPNGTWTLYARDPVAGTSGSIGDGWLLFITTNTPTAAQVVAFGGKRYDDGQVHLSWQTSGEVDNLGFRVYRDGGQGPELITPGLVAGSALTYGTSTVLATDLSYAWQDGLPQGTGAVQYWLQDVDLRGQGGWHGPMVPETAGGEPPVSNQSPLLSQVGQRPQATGQAIAAKSPGARLREAADLATQRSLAARPGVKITIAEEGWYRLCQEDLAAAGLDPGVDPQSLRLYRRGREQAIQVHSATPGQFDPGDCIEFYASGQDTPDPAPSTYWLAADGWGGRRVPVIDSAGEPGGAASFLATVERRDRVIYFAGLLNGDAGNFFGQAVLSEPSEQILTLAALDPNPPGEAVLEVALQGVGDITNKNPDHVIQVQVNGVLVGQVVYDGQTRQAVQFAVAQSLLRAGDNIVTLQAQGGEMDVSLVDYVRLSYYRLYTAANDYLLSTVETAGAGRQAVSTQTLNGFTSSAIRVFDVTNPAHVRELVGQVTSGNDHAVTVAVQGQGPRRLLALTEAQIKSPVSLSPNTPSSWHAAAGEADFFIISHASFATAVQKLQAQRQAEGLQVVVVDVEDLYDEFSYGERSPDALRAFLRKAWEQGQQRLRFVLLVGDATYDTWGYLGIGHMDFVPTKLIDTQYMEMASDDWFGDFDEDGNPDIAVGRLPVQTADMAQQLVDKLLTQSARSQGSGNSVALLVADYNDGYNFEQVNSSVRQYLPSGMSVTEVRRREMTDTEAQERIQAQLNAGTILVTYAGHGSYREWRGVFQADAAYGLANAEVLPVVVAMTCLNGYFHDAARDSLAEAFLHASAGGAAAVWASSGMTYATGQAQMLETWTRLLFANGDAENGLTLGEAAVQAKASTADKDIARTWILFGDPSMLPRW